MKRVLGLDYGTKTVGVAVSDELFITAQGLETITRKEENKLRKTLARIEELIKEYGVEEIVLGYPKNMDNTIGERGKAAEEFPELEKVVVDNITLDFTGEGDYSGYQKLQVVIAVGEGDVYMMNDELQVPPLPEFLQTLDYTNIATQWEELFKNLANKEVACD